MLLNNKNIISLFSGAGGLDFGFKKAGFNILYSNEYDKDIWETHQKNFPETILDKRNIAEIEPKTLPDCLGIIGGPPCQSWSEAGAMRGLDDNRGKLFFDFIRILKEKQPLFFLAENVSGMLAERHKSAFEQIQELFVDAGYRLSCKLLNAADYNVPQDRKRVFFVGYRNDIGLKFCFPNKSNKKVTLRDAIYDLKKDVLASENNKTNGDRCVIPNHEYMIGDFSTIYMSRNRVRSWDEVSFTIQAGGRHAPLHPQAPKMKFIEQNVRIFVPSKEHLYRRLSIRECARVQTFPDNYVFYYSGLSSGYKMIGNAVPINLAYALAKVIMEDLEKLGLVKNKKNSYNTQLEFFLEDMVPAYV